MRILYIILGIIFIIFAGLQYNDIDPYLWAPYYLNIAAILLLAAMNKYYKWWIWTTVAITVLWMISYVPGVIEWFKQGMPSISQTMKAETPYIENMREFLGLGISLASLLTVYFKIKK